jgi:hypothetical protein
MERSIGEMRVSRISLQFAAIITMFLVMACTPTSTKFTTIWKDPAYQVKPEKILVISAFQNPYRWTFEDHLVRVLKNRRIDAVMSITVMTDMSARVLNDKDAIAAKAKEVGADTVLINGPVNRSPSGTTHTDKPINTQTDVFDMKSNRLIMSATAETWVKNGIPYTVLVHSYVEDLVNKLSQLGLF